MRSAPFGSGRAWRRSRERVAAIDCGTNSIRLLIAERDGSSGLRDLERRLEIVRLGQGVDATGEFHPDACGVRSRPSRSTRS